MAFERISIIGVGLIGGSLGLALRRTGFAGEIVGGRRDETLAQAATGMMCAHSSLPGRSLLALWMTGK